jgi:hypothetical protein
MGTDSLISEIISIMTDFALRTGLSPAGEAPPHRYLWTDAFAVCNFLEIHRLTRDERYKHLALKLVDQVHNTLGRHRHDDPRTGWISGLDEYNGKLHPTKGGLRIGKDMNERRPNEPYDEQLEWDRDGQYFHYLTKWMHALNRISETTGDIIYNQWAMELAKTAHEGFIYNPAYGGQKRMYWKMSIDLSYPLVPSMGQHDPLDGFLTYNLLQLTADKAAETPSILNLETEIEEMADMCRGRTWATDDPLGIGELLGACLKVAQLTSYGDRDQVEFLISLLDAALKGLKSYTGTNQLNLPAEFRLAFRELGLSIGLQALMRLKRLIGRDPVFFYNFPGLHPLIESLMPYVKLREKIIQFWLEHGNRKARTWKEHLDINSVMLGTSLAPHTFLAF